MCVRTPALVCISVLFVAIARSASASASWRWAQTLKNSNPTCRFAYAPLYRATTSVFATVAVRVVVYCSCCRCCIIILCLGIRVAMGTAKVYKASASVGASCRCWLYCRLCRRRCSTWWNWNWNCPARVHNGRHRHRHHHRLRHCQSRKAASRSPVSMTTLCLLCSLIWPCWRIPSQRNKYIIILCSTVRQQRLDKC